MNIIGIGVDATDIPRVAETIRRFGDRFLDRIYTDRERAYCLRRRDPSPHFAARFSAKEAAMKALGTGHSQGVFWRDIEVRRSGGPPHLHFTGGAAARFKAMGGEKAFITLTHAETLAIAQVILVGP